MGTVAAGAKTKVNKVPGPGQYELIIQASAPKPGFGTSKRPDLGQSGSKNVPGPGNYTIKESRGTSYGFGSQKRAGMANLNCAPGPGKYNLPGDIGAKYY